MLSISNQKHGFNNTVYFDNSGINKIIIWLICWTDQIIGPQKVINIL